MQEKIIREETKEASSSSVWLLGIAGLGAGIAIGLLIAPEKGEKIRSRLKSSVEKGLDHILESVENSLEKAYKNALESENSETADVQ